MISPAAESGTVAGTCIRKLRKYAVWPPAPAKRPVPPVIVAVSPMESTPGVEVGGWVVEIGGKTIYHAGDTALFGDMRLIGELWDIGLACLPIGDCFTKGPAHATRAAEMLLAKAVLPIHYNTFPPSKQDPHAFARDLERRAKIQALPLKSGETVDL